MDGPVNCGTGGWPHHLSGIARPEITEIEYLVGMNIEHADNGKKGSFKAVSDGVQAGEMTYTWAGPGKFIIDHTDVNPDFSGQGVGKKMVMAAVAYARENHVKILPLCPFAKSVFDKDASLEDVLF